MHTGEHWQRLHARRPATEVGRYEPDLISPGGQDQAYVYCSFGCAAELGIREPRGSCTTARMD